MTAEWAIFIVLLAVTTTAALFNRLRRVLLRRRLIDLATTSGWTYSGADRFDLARRMTRLLPVPAPADIQVRDILYRQEGTRATYIATVDYTVGGARGLRRLRQLVKIFEQRSDGPVTCKLLADTAKRIDAYAAACVS